MGRSGFSIYPITNPKVHFYGSVSYFVRGRAEQTLAIRPQDLGNDNLDDVEIRKLKVRAGDIVEFVYTSDNSLIKRGFCRVVAIMTHEKMTFLVISWIIPTGRVHPSLALEEFQETPLFTFTPFHPLTILDHPRFVNHTHFTKLNGKLYRNSWIFDMV